MALPPPSQGPRAPGGGSKSSHQLILPGSACVWRRHSHWSFTGPGHAGGGGAHAPQAKEVGRQPQGQRSARRGSSGASGAVQQRSQP